MPWLARHSGDIPRPDTHFQLNASMLTTASCFNSAMQSNDAVICSLRLDSLFARRTNESPVVNLLSVIRATRLSLSSMKDRSRPALLVVLWQIYP